MDRRTWRGGVLLAWSLAWAAAAHGHDIPDARVERAIQLTLRPGRLEIDYEVSLAELTLVQDLRALGVEFPAGIERRELYGLYARHVGPLNARGFLVEFDGREVEPRFESSDVVVEDHARLTFHIALALPARGLLRVRDTNYASSEGTSRLAARGQDVRLVDYDGPALVTSVPIRPVWQLSDEEERRTKQFESRFEAIAAASTPADEAAASPSPAAARPPSARGLTGLLDLGARTSVPLLGLLALALGAAHALQPGHGKALVAAASLASRGGAWRGLLLALVVTLAHTGSVLVLAALAWLLRDLDAQAVHAGLRRAAGFAIAAIGCWRLGRSLGGHEPAGAAGAVPSGADLRWLLSAGLSGGLVPCWDAILLLLLAAALGRLGLGLLLLLAFSAGMALTLALVGVAAGTLRARITARDPQGRWPRRLGLAGAAGLAAVGIALLAA